MRRSSIATSGPQPFLLAIGDTANGRPATPEELERVRALLDASLAQGLFGAGFCADCQREFARRVAAVEKLKAAHRASLAELDALFAALQHRAFCGEL